MTDLRPRWIAPVYAIRLDAANGLLGFFAKVKSAAQRFRINAVGATQLLGREADAVYVDQGHALAGVQGLRSLVRPAAVSRFVVAGRVDSIKGRSFWGAAHVGKERSVVVSPLHAHADAFRAIEAIPTVRRRVTTALRVLPCYPLFCVGPVDGVAVSREQLPNQFTMKATTTLRSAIHKAGALAVALCSALAQASPVRLPANGPVVSKNGPASEFTAGQVFMASRHGLYFSTNQ